MTNKFIGSKLKKQFSLLSFKNVKKFDIFFINKLKLSDDNFYNYKLWEELLAKKMDSKFFLFALLISCAIHFFLFKNISTLIDSSKYNISNHFLDIYFFEKIINLPDSQVESISQAIKSNDLNSSNQKIVKNILSKTLLEIDDSDLALGNPSLCENCVYETSEEHKNKDDNFGDEVNKIQMKFKVFHDVGPNKKQNINPLGQSSFKENLNSSKNHIGYVNIIFNRTDDLYLIEFDTEINGISSIYLNNLYQKSEGVINHKGLVPNKYIYIYGERIKNYVDFDWANKELKIKTKSNNLKYPLPDNAQDQLSVLFNFMFLNPLQNMNIYVTNGKKIKKYDYLYIEDGKYRLSQNNFDYIQISKISDNNDKLDLFLAKNYGFLPLKIIHTNKDLSYISQELISFQINGLEK